MRELPEDHQAAVALHWFAINFRPFNLEAASAVLGTGVLGRMILGEGTEETSTNEKDSSDRRLTAPDELQREFDGLIAASTLAQLGLGLQASAPFWTFIPPPERSLVEREPGLQSRIDATEVAHDAQALTDHFEYAQGTPARYGQNYWPGAELQDELLVLKREVHALKELAAVQPVAIEPIERAVGQLADARSKIGAWFAESYVKALGNAAGNATIAVIIGALGASAWWWHTLFSLVTTVWQSASIWLVSLAGG